MDEMGKAILLKKKNKAKKKEKDGFFSLGSTEKGQEDC